MASDSEEALDDSHCTDDDDGDQSCQSSCDYGDDDPPERGKSYLILTEDDLRAAQEECTARVADLLSIPPGFAAALLRRYQWSVARLEDAWFSDERRVRDAAGLPAGAAPAVISDRRLTCAICFDAYSAGEMVSAGCSHFYCRECWRGYVRAAVGDGPRCLSLRCPDPSCSVAVVRELVAEVAGEGDDERYATFALRSYVEESNKVRRWCPGPGCAHAAELLSGEPCAEAVDVLCPCAHEFCLRCGEEAHRPVSCAAVSLFLSSFEPATADYVACHTKHCPACRRPIDKDDGCIHMTCPAPCDHHFCWLCLGPWDKHDGGFYKCRRYDGSMAAGEEARRERLRRHAAYYDGWVANGVRRRKALEELERVRGEEIEKLTGWFGTADFGFLEDAYEQIAGGRRALRWLHAYGFCLDPEREKLKHELFEVLMADADGWLRRLQECAASRAGTDSLYGPEDGGVSYWELKEKLGGLTRMTAARFRNLADAFEGDLAEVKPTADLPIHRPSQNQPAAH